MKEFVNSLRIWFLILLEWPMRERKWPRNKFSTRESPIWTFRRRQRERCAMLAPRPGVFTFLIVNASVAGKYAYGFLVFFFIYSQDKHKLHSRLTIRKKKKLYDSSSPFFFFCSFIFIKIEQLWHILVTSPYGVWHVKLIYERNYCIMSMIENI